GLPMSKEFLAMRGESYPEHVMKTLRSYIAQASTTALPDEVAAKVKQHILIMLACMISGTQLKPGKLALSFARKRNHMDNSSTPGTNLSDPGGVGSLVSGRAARAGECDGVHRRSRADPGASSVPAALAMAEETRASGDLLIKATS